MMQDSAILKGLNEQQRAAVSAPLCNALVLAVVAKILFQK